MTISDSPLKITGYGAVTPHGWSSDLFFAGVKGELSEVPAEALPVYGGTNALVRRVPARSSIPEYMQKGRFRKVARITEFAMEAARECVANASLSKDAVVIVAVSSGSISYSEQFFAPMARSDSELPCAQFFPETVFNAPCSHVCAFLDHSGPSYALLGDATVGIEALCLGRDLLISGFAPECLIVGSEEISPLQLAGMGQHVGLATAGNPRGIIFSEGSCALRVTLGTGGTGELQLPPFVPGAVRPLGLFKQLRRLVTELKEGSSPVTCLLAGLNGGPLDRVHRLLLPMFAETVSLSHFGEAGPASSLWQILAATRMQRKTLVTTLGLHQRCGTAVVSPLID
jgi:hypothetical protein